MSSHPERAPVGDVDRTEISRERYFLGVGGNVISVYGEPVAGRGPVRVRQFVAFGEGYRQVESASAHYAFESVERQCYVYGRADGRIGAEIYPVHAAYLFGNVERCHKRVGSRNLEALAAECRYVAGRQLYAGVYLAAYRYRVDTGMGVDVGIVECERCLSAAEVEKIGYGRCRKRYRVDIRRQARNVVYRYAVDGKGVAFAGILDLVNAVLVDEFGVGIADQFCRGSSLRARPKEVSRRRRRR